MEQLFEIIKDSVDYNSILKILIAALIGVIVGVERELRRKPTGIKTLIVISVASALLTIISIKSVEVYSTLTSNINMDPMRLPAQIVSGIGFLGAGVIWKKTNDVVQGLTTAAIVWGVGAMGISVGAGFISEAIIAMICMMIGVELVPFLMEKFTNISMYQKVVTLKLTLTSEQELKLILKKVRQSGIRVKNVKIKDDKDGIKSLEIRGYMDGRKYITDVYDDIKNTLGIKHIEIYE